MRHGLGLVLFGILAATLGLATARASGVGTTTTTTTTTTTATTVTTAAPSYGRLAPSYLPAACVGAGAAVIAEPGRPPIALGTPASSLGPSAYPAQSPLVAFGSATASGSTCQTAQVTLQSVSLLHGAVTATSVQATAGRGSATGVEINGSPAGLAPGQMTAIGTWAQLWLGKRVGRLAAPLVLVLLAPHDSLPAGTTIAVAFAAAPQSAATQTKPHSTASAQHGGKTDTAGSQKQASRPTQKLQQPAKPPPDYPASSFPFVLGGGLAPDAKRNDVVAIAMHYLGVRYLWGGASPRTGFDCSGLVMYVFAQLGVVLPHYAAAQWHAPDSVWVAPNRLQPGELVFFTGSDGTRRAPGHVGIYVGDGYFIDAPHTGSFVRIESLNEGTYANQYVGARRLFGASLGGSGSRPDAKPTPAAAAAWQHLVALTVAATPVKAVDQLFPRQVGLNPDGEMPVIAAAGTGAFSHASRADEVWGSATLGGLFLLLAAGVFVFRRRRLPRDA